jgi:hypothetical protein
MTHLPASRGAWQYALRATPQGWQPWSSGPDSDEWSQQGLFDTLGQALTSLVQQQGMANPNTPIDQIPTVFQNPGQAAPGQGAAPTGGTDTGNWDTPTTIASTPAGKPTATPTRTASQPPPPPGGTWNADGTWTPA